MIKLDESFREKDIFNELPFFICSVERKGFFLQFWKKFCPLIRNPDPWVSIFFRIWKPKFMDPRDPDPKHCLSVNKIMVTCRSGLSTFHNYILLLHFFSGSWHAVLKFVKPILKLNKLCSTTSWYRVITFMSKFYNLDELPCDWTDVSPWKKYDLAQSSQPFPR